MKENKWRRSKIQEVLYEVRQGSAFGEKRESRIEVLTEWSRYSACSLSQTLGLIVYPSLRKRRLQRSHGDLNALDGTHGMKLMSWSLDRIANQGEVEFPNIW